jgi:type I site-specific restriction-modification system R (restriction) subunit
MDYLQNGIQISYQEKGETKSTLVYLVDYNNFSRNSFIVANQWTYEEYERKRPDIVIFLNGLPVVIVELKSPRADSVTIEDASITQDSTFDIYTDKYGVNPKNVTVNTGSITLEFKAQEVDVNIKVVVK